MARNGICKNMARNGTAVSDTLPDSKVVSSTLMCVVTFAWRAGEDSQGVTYLSDLCSSVIVGEIIAACVLLIVNECNWSKCAHPNLLHGKVICGKP